MMDRRFRLSLVLLFAALLGLWCPGEVHAEPVGKLRVDGVAIGMTFTEVLHRLGRPKAVRETRSVIALVYAAPRHRPEETAVWFHQGKVVYCSGYTLQEEGEPLHLFGLPGYLLTERFGPLEPLQLFAGWWPKSGIVLAGTNNIWPDEPLKAPIALRDPHFPIRWVAQADGRQLSEFEPWADDEKIGWLAGDLELGMPEARARELAGDLRVVYRGGFVQAILAPPEALLNHRLGHRDLSQIFEVGHPPERFAADSAQQEFPKQGWFSPASSGRIRMENGKVAEIKLELRAPELFAALEALAPTR